MSTLIQLMPVQPILSTSFPTTELPSSIHLDFLLRRIKKFSINVTSFCIQQLNAGRGLLRGAFQGQEGGSQLQKGGGALRDENGKKVI